MTGSTFTTFGATFNSATTSGNAIVLGVTFGNVNPTITVTDSQGNSYAQAIRTWDSNHNQGSAILYAVNITGGANNTVTVHFSSPVAWLGLGIHEYSGILTTAAVDVTSGNTGLGTSPSSGSATTTSSGDLIFGVGVEDSTGYGDTFTAGTGFTKRVDLGSAAAYADESEVQSGAGSVAATWSLSPSGNTWIADLAAFKTVAGGNAPSISSLSPTSGQAGTSVTVTGTNFGSTQGTSTISFNGMAATATSWSSTSIVTSVPFGATTGGVVVSVGGIASNAANFTVPVPNISSLSPSAGPINTSVTISGTNFGSTQGNSTVKFNGVTASPSSWSATSIVAPVPSGATTGNVVVTVGGLSSNGVNFSVTTTSPTITSISPTSGAVGTSVTIGGANFGTTQGSSTVTFNGTSATPTSWSATSIIAPVPSGATTGNVIVTVGGNASNAVTFTVIVPPPTITSITPDYGSTGTSVMIAGTNFGATQGSSTVTFDGTTAAPTSWSQTQIVVPVPTGATSGNVVVTVGGVASNTYAFWGGSSPYIATLSPQIAAVGASVTISGGNFGSSQGTSAVTFAGPTSTNPTLVQHVSCPNSTGNGLSSYTCRLPNAALSSNLIVVSLTYGDGSASGVSITDDVGNTYTRAVHKTHAGGQDLDIDYVSGATAGARSVTAAFTGGDANWIAMTISEFYNVAASSPVDGSSSNTNSSTTVTAGNFTTTASGDLIYQIAVQDTSGYVDSWSQGSSPWTLLSADSLGGFSAQYEVQTTHGAINPTFTMSPTGSFVSAGIAFKAAAAGTAPSGGIRIVHLQHNSWWSVGSTGNTSYTSVPLKFPSSGNLIVAAWIGAPNYPVNSISDGTNTYTQIGSAFDDGNQSGEVQTFYAKNAATSSSLVMTVALGSGTFAQDQSNLLFYDVAGADPSSPYCGTRATSSGDQATGTSTPAPSITPCASQALILSQMARASNTVTLISSGSLDSTGFTPDMEDSPLDQNNGWAHYNSDGNAYAPSWIGSGAPNGYAITSVAFQASATATSSGGTVTAIPTSWSNTSIVTPVPATAISGNVTVTVSSVASNGVPFTVVIAPVISSLNPSAGVPGMFVTIDGTNFGTSQGTGTVKFGGLGATVVSWTATRIVAAVPANAATGNVVVHAGGVDSNGVLFTIVVPPTITNLSPDLGPTGTSVTITGTNFGSPQGTSTVTFNGTTATITSWGNTSIVATVPTGATTGDVMVIVSGVPSNDDHAFTVTNSSGPFISSLSPAQGPFGASVLITGSNFGTSGTVTFNGLAAATSNWTSTSITVVVPTYATSGDVHVTVANVESNGADFTVTGSGGSTTSDIYFYFSDAVGTSRIITASDGTVCYDADLYPFGGERAYVDNCDSAYKFTGKERDSESGLDNFGARYDSSQYGRFMTPDPKMPSLKHLVNPQKWNKYAYTINNPLRYFDPDGMEEIEVVLRAFIQQRTVTDPVGRTFAGDNRGFSSAAGASSRTSITVRIETDASKSANPILSVTPSVSPTRLLDANGNQISSQLAQGAPSVSGTRDANGSVVLNFKQDVINPYEPQLSILGIKSDLNVTVPQNGSSITTAGTTSGFPAFELNVTPEGQPTSNIPLYSPNGGPGSIVNTNFVFTQRPLPPPPPPCTRDRDQQCQ